MATAPYPAILVDDEAAARQALRLMLEAHCPHVQVVAEAQNVPEALRMLQQQPPAIVFLDVTMPNYSGFELLSTLAHQPFAVVFVTGYSDYALKAFEVAAQDYLLKPIDELALVRAVERAIAYFEGRQAQEELRRLRSAPPPDPAQSSNQSAAEHEPLDPSLPLRVPTQLGARLVPVQQLVYLAAEGAYSRLYLQAGPELLASRVLKRFEAELPPHQFLRVHRSYLVNLRHVQEFSRLDGGLLRMSTGAQLPIARSRLANVRLSLGLK